VGLIQIQSLLADPETTFNIREHSFPTLVHPVHYFANGGGENMFHPLQQHPPDDPGPVRHENGIRHSRMAESASKTRGNSQVKGHPT